MQQIYYYLVVFIRTQHQQQQQQQENANNNNFENHPWSAQQGKKSFHTKKIENLCRIFSLERGGKGWSMHGKRYMPFATLLCKLNTVTNLLNSLVLS
jgi:hypothetical protein